MKRERICSAIIAAVSFVLLFIPIYPLDIGYFFTFRILFIAHLYLPGFALREILVIFCSSITIAATILHLLKNNFKTKVLVTVCSYLYVIVSTISLLVEFPHRNSVLWELKQGMNIIWLMIYFALLITITVLAALQHLQHLPLRRPTKTERMQAQIDELQKQVDELKKGE